MIHDCVYMQVYLALYTLTECLWWSRSISTHAHNVSYKHLSLYGPYHRSNATINSWHALDRLHCYIISHLDSPRCFTGLVTQTSALLWWGCVGHLEQICEECSRFENTGNITWAKDWVLSNSCCHIPFLVHACWFQHLLYLVLSRC